jgi:Uma2 family endonuclease
MTVARLSYEEDIYPESNGQSVAETDLHRDELLELVATLKTRYGREDDVYVSGNLLFYYEEGNPRKVVAPDVFIVRGVRKQQRRKYLLWKEERAPFFIIEVTSESTRQEDLKRKKELYERLGVEEYILYDPYGEYLRPPLQGFRLVRGRYQPIAPEADGSLRSLTTGLILRREGERLSLVDATTGERLLRPDEVASLARQEAAREKARAEWEAAAREVSEARAAALEQEVERLRRELGRRG